MFWVPDGNPWIIADCLSDVNLDRDGKLQADVATQQALAQSDKEAGAVVGGGEPVPGPNDGPWGTAKRKLVGMRGFEPPTPSSRTKCATRLRYIPKSIAAETELGLALQQLSR
jgi:hypothetical protein